MRIDLKTKEEIKIMEEGGKRLGEVVNNLLLKITSGITTEEIDKIAEELIKKQGGKPSFKTVKNYYWTTCLPINEQVVHTPPSKRFLKKGDLLTIDIGMYYQGYHTDFAISLLIEDNNRELKQFLKVGEETLEKAINTCQVSKRIGHISKTIEEEIYKNGYFVLKQLTGHGIGKKLHEDPYILGFLDRPLEETEMIKPGLTIAIEIIYSMGTEKIVYEKDNKWSVITKDKSLSACFEKTIAITDKKLLVLT